MSAVWFVASDNRIVVDKLRYADDGAYINDATITAVVLDSTGVDIGDPEGTEVAFAYQTGSNGKYVGIVPLDNFVFVANEEYTAVLTIEAGGYTHTERITRRANYDDRICTNE